MSEANQLSIPANSQAKDALITSLTSLIIGAQLRIASLKEELKAIKEDLRRWQSSLAKETGEKPVRTPRKARKAAA